jgi:hypothetical protein
MVQALVNLPTVKIFSGHKTLAMVERYAHASTAHGQASLDKLEARYRSNASTVAPSATHAAAGPKQGSKHG